MKKTSKFWKLFKKDDKPQKEKDVISTSSQSETVTVNIEKIVLLLKKKAILIPKKTR